MWLRPVIFLFVVCLAEYYAFIVVRSAVRGLPQTWRIGIISAYFIATIAIWLSVLDVLAFHVVDWARLPHLRRNIYIAFALGFTVGKLLILVVMLIDDLRRLVLWIINLFYTGGTKTPEIPEETAGQGITRSVFLSRLALALGGTALAGFLYGITNRYNYHIRRIKIKLPNLPPSFQQLKIVQISDIHSGSFDNHDAVAAGISKIIAEDPNIIFFTGDLVNNRAEEILPYMDIFSRLKPPMGVFSTLGNHDYGDYVQWPSKEEKAANLERLKAHHAAMGWKLLMNEHALISHGDGSLAIIGIENWSAKPQFPKYGKMAQAYAGLKDDACVKILLSHDPSHWDAEVLPKYPDIDLSLAGHTHGMQFGIEIPGFKWSPVKYVYKKWAGLYQQGRQYLYVNRGFGFLGYPGRLGILPEITVITLV